MKKKQVVIGTLLVIIVLLIIINAIYFKIKKRENLLSPAEALITENYEINVNDYYVADYMWLDTTKHNFDKYLAVDVSIENISEDKQKIMTIGHFYIDDGNYKLKSVVVDENHKEFSKELYPGDTFNITLTFPVDEANEYILYYNESLKEEDNEKIGFQLSGIDLETKEVEQTVDHFLVDDGEGKGFKSDEETSGN